MYYLSMEYRVQLPIALAAADLVTTLYLIAMQNEFPLSIMSPDQLAVHVLGLYRCCIACTQRYRCDIPGHKMMPSRVNCLYASQIFIETDGISSINTEK